MSLKASEFIENQNALELRKLLEANPDVAVSELIDPQGKSLLHEATFNECENSVRVLLDIGNRTLTPDQLSTWVNLKDNGDGFTALHFASFKGKPVMCDLLLTAGADMQAKNNFGINMLHVAAQGE